MTERGPDRRQAPRRADDAHLHYARELLCAAALAAAADPGSAPAASAVLDAAEQYRRAVANTEGAP